MPAAEPDVATLRLSVRPSRLRWWYWRALGCLFAWGAWMWLAGAGAALVVLLCEAHKPWQREPFVLLLKKAQVTRWSVEPWRVALRTDDEVVEVFRDEVDGADWAALRRLLLER